jgi:hypothetical protein
MRLALRFLLITAPAWLVSVLSAQTFIGNLNGTHQHSTFEGLSGNLPLAGWTALSSSPRVFNTTNDLLINGAGPGPFAPFSVQYITSTAPVANMQYTLSFLMGYASAPATGNANYSFSLGTWNGSAFSVLATTSGGPIAYNGTLESSTSNGVLVSLNFITGGSVSSDVLAVQWAQTNTSTSANYFGIDNVTLSVSAIPEPGTYAAIAGLAAVFAAGVRRRLVRRGA